MKQLKKIYYLLLIVFVTACGDSISETYYLSDNEKHFLPYNINDSIKLTYVSLSNNNVNQSNVLKIQSVSYSILQFDNGMYDSRFAHSYQKKSINIGENKDDALINLMIHKKNDELNIDFSFFSTFFIEPITTGDNLYLAFMYDDFAINDSTIFYNNKYVINSVEYYDVYRLVALPPKVNDTLYYSPNYGLIKLVTDVGTYTFKNLN